VMGWLPVQGILPATCKIEETEVKRLYTCALFLRGATSIHLLIRSESLYLTNNLMLLLLLNNYALSSRAESEDRAVSVVMQMQIQKCYCKPPHFRSRAQCFTRWADVNRPDKQRCSLHAV
jgi:hypothetical protein